MHDDRRAGAADVMRHTDLRVHLPAPGIAAELADDLVDLLDPGRTDRVAAGLQAAARVPRLGFPPFDRIVMNLPLAAPEFLPAAAALCRDGGTIHLYALEEQGGEYLPLIREVTRGEVAERQVRTYSPGKWHAVYDITVEKKGC